MMSDSGMGRELGGADLLRGFFFRTRNKVSINSKYLVKRFTWKGEFFLGQLT